MFEILKADCYQEEVNSMFIACGCVKAPVLSFPFGLKVLILKYLALKYKEPTCLKICMMQCDGKSHALLV